VNPPQQVRFVDAELLTRTRVGRTHVAVQQTYAAACFFCFCSRPVYDRRDVDASALQSAERIFAVARILRHARDGARVNGLHKQRPHAS
jgi:hypothetical protein